MDWAKVDDLVASYFLSSRAHEDRAINEHDYALGFRAALRMIQEFGFSLAEDWQIEDPRFDYVDIQVDKDVYALFYPQEQK